jgi:hypothetical protein
MILETNLGNFGTFKNLKTCIRLEEHKREVDYWGINLKLTKDLILSYQEVLKILQEKIYE